MVNTTFDVGAGMSVLTPPNKSIWREMLETKEAGQVDQIFSECHEKYIHPFLRPGLGGPATIIHHNYPRGLVTENTGVPDTISLFLTNPITYFVGGFLRGWLIRDSEEEKELFGWIDNCYTQDWYRNMSTLNWVRKQKEYYNEKDEDTYTLLDSLEKELSQEIMGKKEEKREGEEYPQPYGGVPVSPYAPYQFLGGGYAVSYEDIFKALKEYVEKIENADEKTRKDAARILEEASRYIGAAALENYSNFGKYLAEVCSKIYKAKENE